MLCVFWWLSISQCLISVPRKLEELVNFNCDAFGYHEVSNNLMEVLLNPIGSLLAESK
jgi:hypothetical protein